MSKLTNNTMSLQNILATVNDLPSASGSGENLNTWSLRITNMSSSIYVQQMVSSSNGSPYIRSNMAALFTEMSIPDIPVGGVVFISLNTPYSAAPTFSSNIIYKVNNKDFAITCNTPGAEEIMVLNYEE